MLHSSIINGLPVFTYTYIFSSLVLERSSAHSAPTGQSKTGDQETEGDLCNLLYHTGVLAWCLSSLASLCMYVIACMVVHTYTYVHVCVHTCVCGIYVCVSVRTCACVCAHVHAYMCVCIIT